MNHADRRLRKELLLMKGEALRIKLGLEMQQWRGPLAVAGGGAELWRGASRFKTLIGLAALLMPRGRARALLKTAAKGALLVGTLRRLWSRA
ncbi:hypothetical protein EV683_10886 [Crenobacter luteus]|uniref:hypothetical protein n=1 Tax=Crenobacter luteus TaxID=1452487 RepID=UPI0010539430|nr:hypothetical protein [Crenobacter luteus]TCP12639.1 hypothetical protein EV683_10886 [Crenobacter luteus]